MMTRLLLLFTFLTPLAAYPINLPKCRAALAGFFISPPSVNELIDQYQNFLSLIERPLGTEELDSVLQSIVLQWEAEKKGLKPIRAYTRGPGELIIDGKIVSSGGFHFFLMDYRARKPIYIDPTYLKFFREKPDGAPEILIGTLDYLITFYSCHRRLLKTRGEGETVRNIDPLEYVRLIYGAETQSSRLHHFTWFLPKEAREIIQEAEVQAILQEFRNP